MADKLANAPKSSEMEKLKKMFDVGRQFLS